jgi:hypothetical protein
MRALMSKLPEFGAALFHAIMERERPKPIEERPANRLFRIRKKKMGKAVKA